MLYFTTALVVFIGWFWAGGYTLYGAFLFGTLRAGIHFVVLAAFVGLLWVSL